MALADWSLADWSLLHPHDIGDAHHAAGVPCEDNVLLPADADSQSMRAPDGHVSDATFRFHLFGTAIEHRRMTT